MPGIKSYYYTLDLVRAAAACLVVVQHARNTLLVDYGDAVRPNLFWKGIYALNFGHEAVIVFFVLSGCVVGRIVVMSAERGTWAWKDYLFDRFSRLWVVLVPALLATVLWDCISISQSSPSSFVHSGGGFAHMIVDPIARRLTWAEFAGNALFVQTILVHPLGSNGPLWSLAYEFWYYMIFPLLYFGIAGRHRAWSRGIMLAAGAALLVFVGWRIALLFLVWLLGVVAFMVHQRVTLGRWTKWFGMAGSLLALLAIMAASRMGMEKMLGGALMMDFWMGIVSACVVFFGLSVEPPAALSRLGAFFSSFSYSLYVFHAPALTCLVAVGLRFGSNGDRLHPSWSAAGMLVAVLVLLYVYSYACYWLFEMRTSSIRKRFKGVELKVKTVETARS